MSTNQDPEKLRIIFWGEIFFVTNDEWNIPVKGGPKIGRDEVIFVIMPNQLPVIDAEQAAEIAETKQASQVASFMNIIVNIALSASMN